MKLRRATVLDVAALAEVESSQLLCAHWGERGWRTELVQASSWVWCAETEKKIVGFAAMRAAAGFGEILNVAVLPQFCRQGVGFLLMSKLLREAREQEVSQLTLEVNIHNRAAISLYHKVGFKEVGRREKFYNGQEDALIMEVKL